MKNNFAILELYRGTDVKEAERNLQFDFKDLTWWSANYETVEHCYEGAVSCMTIIIDKDKKQDFINSYKEFNDNYTFGYSELICPADAIWYSFSKTYLKDNIIEISICDLEYVKHKLMYPRLK